jgi:hypothetical protein
MGGHGLLGPVPHGGDAAHDAHRGAESPQRARDRAPVPDGPGVQGRPGGHRAPGPGLRSRPRPPGEHPGVVHGGGRAGDDLGGGRRPADGGRRPGGGARRAVPGRHPRGRRQRGAGRPARHPPAARAARAAATRGRVGRGPQARDRRQPATAVAHHRGPARARRGRRGASPTAPGHVVRPGGAAPAAQPGALAAAGLAHLAPLPPGRRGGRLRAHGRRRPRAARGIARGPRFGRGRTSDRRRGTAVRPRRRPAAHGVVPRAGLGRRAARGRRGRRGGGRGPEGPGTARASARPGERGVDGRRRAVDQHRATLHLPTERRGLPGGVQSLHGDQSYRRCP